MRMLRTLMNRNGRPVDITAIDPKIAETCRQEGVRLLYLFGSYVGGRPSVLSDVDVGVLMERAPDLSKICDLMSRLTDIFEDEAIDLVDLHDAPDLLAHRILRDGVCFKRKKR